MRQIRHPTLDQTGVVPGGPQTVTGDTKLKISASSSSIKAAYPAKRIDISRPSDKTNMKQKNKNIRKTEFNQIKPKRKKENNKERKKDSLLRSEK
ncbi:hypothetical protein BO83DRAFT_377825 [Aspergillus eucalypticola CBS 122712]|uniref:Uncharacterized protein n=1 Tax=Aspergillus eucalypticola (strain CBS 122712 / IBT 29274) TaxID=1448314 RepID=A0A317VNY1_ASPEC|nr:uncharacterized protein BO83DRAFT_377825 [Aspergillus eucalypticola CBS 122712]PWY74777.1 hypothetical protein BO83DRAFT_377825 [Aspergillus eucalypticola CBS 122712]